VAGAAGVSSKDALRRAASDFSSQVRKAASQFGTSKSKGAAAATRGRGGGRGRGGRRGRGRGGGRATASGPAFTDDSDDDAEMDDRIDTGDDDGDAETRADMRRAQQLQLIRGEGMFRDLSPDDLAALLALADWNPDQTQEEGAVGAIEDSNCPSGILQDLYSLIMLGRVVPVLNMNPFPDVN